MKKIFIWILVVTFAVSILLVGVSCKKTVETTTTAAPETTAAAETTAAETTAAPETTAAYNPADKVIYFVSNLIGHPVIRTVFLGLIQKAAELGYTIKVAGPLQNDVPATIAALEQVVAQKPDAIITWVNAPEFFPALEAAKNAGIPVGDVHTLSFVKANNPVGITFVAGGDQITMGQNMSDILAKKTDGKGIVGRAVSAFTNPNEQTISDAFKEYTGKNYPDMKVLDPIEIGTEGATAESVSKLVALMQSNPKMNAGISTTGAAAQVWANAFDETGRKDIYFLGMDYTLANLDLIKSGKIFGIMGQPLYEEGAESIVLMDKVLRGETVELLNQLPIPAVTQDTPDLVDKYYKIVTSVEDEVSKYLDKAYQTK